VARVSGFAQSGFNDVAHGAKIDAQRSAARPHGTLQIPKAALA